jgi:hypothetical protein
VVDWAIANAHLPFDRLIVSVDESHILDDPAAADFVRNVRTMGLASSSMATASSARPNYEHSRRTASQPTAVASPAAKQHISN